MDVKTPDMGVEKAEVSSILVAVGQMVQLNQPLVLLESAKASIEVPSPVAGVVQKIHIQKGDWLVEGALILSVENALLPESSVSSATSVASTESSTEAIPQKNDHQIDKQIDTQTKQVLAEDTPQSALQQRTEKSRVTTDAHPNVADVYAGPAVRFFARTLGVNLGDVHGTGKAGRILKEDVAQFVKQRLNAQQPSSVLPNVMDAPVLDIAQFDLYGGGDTRAFSKLQQAAIAHMRHNPEHYQVTQFDMADITELDTWRKELNADRALNIKLTLLPFVVKAVAHVLKQPEFVHFNAHFINQQTLYLRHEVHINIAIAVDDGLFMPVVRQPDQCTIRQIAQNLQQLQEKAAAGRFTPAEFAGGGFSISSLGNIGGTGFTPLISTPQVAILGLSKASLQPVWQQTQFVPRLMLPLSLSYDHRVINGKDAALFCQALAMTLADIRRLLL